MKTMRLIDLLKDIAEGKIPPKKVIYHGIEYKYDEENKDCSGGNIMFQLEECVGYNYEDLNEKIIIE